MKNLAIIGICIFIFGIFSCADEPDIEISVNPVDYNEFWELESHSNEAAPDYDIVFPQDKVLRVDITIENDSWNTMQKDLSTNLSSGGPGGGPGGGMDVDSDFTPVWVPCLISFNDKEWNKVGIRYKGNSSLSSVYQSSIDKYSFKLDFDEFEDDYPEIKNQRFYGFKQLNLNNNFIDYSEMHEKVAPELFREFGVPAPQTSFVAVYINKGSGSEYFGLYTLVEEVDDTMIETQFSWSSDNLYKPEGTGATFANGSFNTSDMYKKTNEDTGDYSDVEALYNAINSTNRVSNVDLWKQELESVFDVDIFLKWLAVNTTIQNWDTYGKMSHNYYLYNNPESNKLQWIPWDNNEAFGDGKGSTASIDLSDIGTSWPLINYIMSNEEYKLIYKGYLSSFISEVFSSEKMDEKYNGYYNLIKEYVVSENSPYSFTSASYFESEVEFLKQHVSTRKNVVDAYIN